MMAAEKLLVEIFERKNSIIEKVKQQTELYNQHLASKALIHGVTPPPWLWNPNPSSHTKQLNKEELISELLLAHPRRPVHYSSNSLYSKPVVTDYPEVSDGFCRETHASNRGLNVGEGPSNVVECHDIDVGYNLNSVPELDGSVSSPVDQIDIRISNIHSAPDQSLARIQRSKSRQRALELRNSAKSNAKSHLKNGKNTGTSSSGIKLSPLDFESVDHVNEATKLPEPCAISSQICGDKEKIEENSQSLGRGSNVHAKRAKESSDRNSRTEEKGCNVLMRSSTKSRSSRKVIGDTKSNEADSRSKEKGKDIDAGRTTRCRSSGISCKDREANEGDDQIEEKGNDAKAGRITMPRSSARPASYICDSLTVYSSADVIPEKDVVDSISVIAQRKDVTQICSMVDFTQQLCSASGSLELIDPPKVSQEVCGVKEAVSEDGWAQKDEAPNVYYGQITRSNSPSRQHDCVNKASEPNVDSSFAKMDGGIVAESRLNRMQQLDNGNEFSAVVRISGGSVHKRRRSENTSCSEQTSNPADSSSASGLRCTRLKLSAAENFVVANSGPQNASGGQVIPDTPNKIEKQDNGDAIVANELETDKVVEDQSFSYRSDCLDTNFRKGLECLVARPPSDCFMLVKPKQLDFDDKEDLNETFGLTVERKRLEILAEKVCTTLLEAASSPDKDSSGNNNVSPSQEKSSVKPEVSSEVGEPWRKSLKSNVAGDIGFPMTRYGPIIDEHPQLKSMNNDSEPACRQSSPYMHKADVTLPKAVGTPDIEINNVNVPSKQGCESSPQLHADEGDRRCEEKDRSATSSYASRCKHSVPTYFSSFTKEAAGDSQLPLAKEVGYRDSTCIEFDASMQFSVEDNHKLSFSGSQGCCGHVDHTSFSNKIMGGSSHLGRNCSSSHGSVGSTGVDDESLDVPRPRELQTTDKFLTPETSSRCYKVKRRKTENQQVNCFTASPSFGIQNLCKTHIDTNIRDLKDVGCSSDTVLGEATIGDKIPDVGMYSNMKHHQAKSIESLPEHQRNKEDGLYSIEDNENPETLLAFIHGKSGLSLVSRLTEKAAGDTQEGCLVEAMTTADPSSITFDARIHGDELQLNLENKDYLLNIETLCTERHLLERKSFSEEDGLLPNRSVQSPHDKDLELLDGDQTMPEELACAERNLLERKSILEENALVSYSVQSPQIEDLDSQDDDQIMPVFEGFIIDPQSDNEELGVPGDIINIDKLDLPRSTIARATILEQICRSASACTPLSYLPSDLKLHKFENWFQSVPDALLEHSDLEAVQFLNEDVDKQFGASFSDVNVNEANNALQGMSYSDGLPCSGTRFGLTPVNRSTSPVGKIWESFSSQTGSSGKRLSSNPELRCFPIEEDPSFSEVNETADEAGDKVQEDIDSLSVNGAKRNPQTNITEVSLNPPASVSASEKNLSRGSVDPISTEASFTRTYSKVKHKLGNSYRNKGEGKENQTLSLGGNGIKMAKESLNNRCSKPKLSGKTSLRNERRKLPEKEPKRNNIVSNVTSFIPLVQQKQAAAVCTGKREIKVKALEAAEAVKRLEEKRENERKLRKEALKLERARMEQENAKQIELNKQKKEEEQKRKDADMAARKRLREEDERKEKERKRKRIEETRRQQKEQEEKLQTEKVEKEKQQSNIDVKMNSKKESHNELKRHQNMGKERGDDITCKKLKTEPRTAAFATTGLLQASISSKECSASADFCDNKQVICALDKSIDTGDLVREKTQEKSYEISPYQSSEDEDEDVEELPTKKFIPSWASKTSVALALPLQQEVDPRILFPPASFCSMDEVLRPRKLKEKKAAL